jgi:hypothetical protein
MPRSLRTIPLSIAAMGMTVDGREISEKDINDIVATYNYRKYGARINLDHSGDWSGWVANNLHGVDLNGGMLGDVLEVTSGENEDETIRTSQCDERSTRRTIRQVRYSIRNQHRRYSGIA